MWYIWQRLEYQEGQGKVHNNKRQSIGIEQSLNEAWKITSLFGHTARFRRPVIKHTHRRGLSVSAAKNKRIQALAFWINELLHIRRLKFEDDFDETEFTIVKMNEIVDEAYIHYLD